MTTPFQPHSIRASVATLRKLKDQEKEIKEQQRQIQELHFDLSIKQAHVLNLQQAATMLESFARLYTGLCIILTLSRPLL
jgi:hypothetical protein